MTKEANKYKETYFGNIGNALSQLGHSLAGGSSDVSISSKAGYMSDIRNNRYWVGLKSIINFAFRPIDGKHHSTNALLIDNQEDFEYGIGLFQDVVCTFFIVIVCPIVAVLLWSVHGIKWIIKKLKK